MNVINAFQYLLIKATSKGMGSSFRNIFVTTQGELSQLVGPAHDAIKVCSVKLCETSRQPGGMSIRLKSFQDCTNAWWVTLDTPTVSVLSALHLFLTGSLYS